MLPLEELLEGELAVELGFERVEEGFEVEVGPAAEELNVTPCTMLDEAQRAMYGMQTYHSATHGNSSINGLGEVSTRTVALEAFGGRIDKILVAAQAGGVADIARAGIGGSQTGEGTVWNE